MREHSWWSWKARKERKARVEPAVVHTFKPKHEYKLALFDGGQYLGSWPLDFSAGRIMLTHKQVMGMLECIMLHEHGSCPKHVSEQATKGDDDGKRGA
jgi:hypothetical protein